MTCTSVIADGNDQLH